MPWTTLGRSAVLFGVCTASIATAELPDPRLDWMAGCWETASGQTREVWTPGADNLMFGFNVVQKDGEVGFFEQLRIQHGEAGWTYYAYPRGGRPTAFDLAVHADQSAEFVNPDHDYPQRLAYVRDGAALDVEISLADGSEPRNWAYRACAD
ncbi:MAG: DUF6265 family protein [Pseudomonadota bacterium]